MNYIIRLSGFICKTSSFLEGETRSGTEADLERRTRKSTHGELQVTVLLFFYGLKKNIKLKYSSGRQDVFFRRRFFDDGEGRKIDFLMEKKVICKPYGANGLTF